MTNNSLYNQYDMNRQSQQTYRNILQKTSLYTYDAIKFIANFVASMIKMVMGK